VDRNKDFIIRMVYKDRY